MAAIVELYPRKAREHLKSLLTRGAPVAPEEEGGQGVRSCEAFVPLGSLGDIGFTLDVGTEGEEDT